MSSPRFRAEVLSQGGRFLWHTFRALQPLVPVEGPTEAGIRSLWGPTWDCILRSKRLIPPINYVWGIYIYIYKWVIAPNGIPQLLYMLWPQLYIYIYIFPFVDVLFFGFFLSNSWDAHPSAWDCFLAATRCENAIQISNEFFLDKKYRLCVW